MHTQRKPGENIVTQGVMDAVREMWRDAETMVGVSVGVYDGTALLGAMRVGGKLSVVEVTPYSHL